MPLTEKQRQTIMKGTITWDGGEWNVLGVGVEREDGKAFFVHLAHTTMKRHQKNGGNPIQINDWVPRSVLEPLLG